MFRFGKVTFTPGFWFLLLGILLAGAIEVLPAVIFAVVLHELGHLLMLHLFRVPVEGISFTLFGAEIRADTRFVPYWKDILCTLAGPAVNLLAAVLFARVAENYLLAGANLLQGCFNLLPLTGLDGARVLHLILCCAADPARADRISRFIEYSFAVVLAAVVLYLITRHFSGGFLLVAIFGVFVGIWREMRGK